MYKNKNERKPAAVIKNRNFQEVDTDRERRMEDKKERNGTLQESMQGRRISQKHRMANVNLQAHAQKNELGTFVG
jgi:hypothetical protein